MDFFTKKRIRNKTFRALRGQFDELIRFSFWSSCWA